MSKDSPLPPSPNRLPTTPERVFDEPTLAEPDFMLAGNVFWSKYKLPVIALLTLVIIALVGLEVYVSIRHNAAVKASERLDAAKNATDYKKVIEKFSGTPAAANACLLLGRERMDAKDYAGAAEAWQKFADKYPQNLLTPVALIGVGGALECSGKHDEARAAYQKAATAYPKSYAAPLARLDEASLLRAQRKLEDARRVYEDILASYPQSEVIPQVQAELSSLKSLPPTPGAAPDAVPPASSANILPLVPGATVPPSATPVAAPASGPITPAAVVPTPPASLPEATASAMSPASPANQPAVAPAAPAAVDAAAALGAPEPVLPRPATPSFTPAATSSSPTPKP